MNYYSTKEIIGLSQHFKSTNWKFLATIEYPKSVSYLNGLRASRHLETLLEKSNGKFFGFWIIVNYSEIDDKKEGDRIYFLLDSNKKLRHLYRIFEEFKINHEEIKYKVKNYHNDRTVTWLTEMIFLSTSKWGYFFGEKVEKKPKKEEI